MILRTSVSSLYTNPVKSAATGLKDPKILHQITIFEHCRFGPWIIFVITSVDNKCVIVALDHNTACAGCSVHFKALNVEYSHLQQWKRLFMVYQLMYSWFFLSQTLIPQSALLCQRICSKPTLLRQRLFQNISTKNEFAVLRKYEK